MHRLAHFVPADTACRQRREGLPRRDAAQIRGESGSHRMPAHSRKSRVEPAIRRCKAACEAWTGNGHIRARLPIGWRKTGMHRAAFTEEGPP